MNRWPCLGAEFPSSQCFFWKCSKLRKCVGTRPAMESIRVPGSQGSWQEKHSPAGHRRLWTCGEASFYYTVSRFFKFIWARKVLYLFGIFNIYKAFLKLALGTVYHIISMWSYWYIKKVSQHWSCIMNAFGGRGLFETGSVYPWPSWNLVSR